MRLEEIRLRTFRNYAEVDFRPGPGLNLLTGENAQGKSNLLEAVYLLATSRSLRAGRESELIQRGAESAQVRATVLREKDADVLLEVDVFQTDKKVVRINGVRRPRVIELLGHLNAVTFGAPDLPIVAGEPTMRRRWLNLEISQISPRYVFELASFKKALEQRNRLLKELRDRPLGGSLLDAWSEQLVVHGAPLIDRRRFFLENLAPLADEAHRELTDGAESLAIRYVSSVPLPGVAGTPALEEAFRGELTRLCAEEVRRGASLAGPQRDDVQFLINGMDARVFGSQGQQRTAVLAVKLAQFRLMEEYVGEPPVVLLDDVMSDLDERRRAHLLGWVRRRCQALLTCTSLRELPSDLVGEACVHQVSAGAIVPAPAERNGE